MKRTQRNFVVEFKSSRRHPTPPASSIWGNTDFKALAREVESMSPQLFKPADAADDTPAPHLDTPSVGQKCDDLSNSAIVVLAPADIPGGKDDVLVDALAPTAATVSGQIPRLQKAPRAVHKRGPNRLGVDAETNVGAQTNLDLPPTSGEELDLLEAENKRLKGLLAELLRTENRRLSKMLERFGIF